MHFIDKEKLTGKVIITATDKQGNTIILVNDDNLIVLNGRNLVASSLVNGSSSIINTIAFGTGGTVSGSSSQVIPVSSTELSVINAIPNLIQSVDFSFAVDSSAIQTISSFTVPKLIFNILIPEITSLNGQGINEIALMLNTNPATAFSIKRFSTITKSEALSISINWTLYF